MTVAIIDYGSGNLHSAAKAFERAARDHAIKQKIVVTARPEEVCEADHIVLPGVGAFKDCCEGLLAIDGMREALEEQVRWHGKPFLGICVGMQLMASRGLEHDVTEGLNWITGDVKPIESGDPQIKIPHMGWNTLDLMRPHPLLDGMTLGPDGLHAYFVHSYQLVPADPLDVIALTSHGGPITAIAGRDNIVGTQFHPEKSQALGLQLIANFLRWTP